MSVSLHILNFQVILEGGEGGGGGGGISDIFLSPLKSELFSTLRISLL